VRKRLNRSRPRSRTLQMRQLKREHVTAPARDTRRPRTRSECRDGVRPCPWVACRHSLYLDINPGTGTIKLNFPDLEPWEMAESCCLDVAERGGLLLEEVGLVMNLTRERIRQVEIMGLLHLKRASALAEVTP
jgi:hypothetical protein